MRWKLELDYEQLKGELGLDHYEGRSWLGWYHHTAMVIAAHGFLTLEWLNSFSPANGLTLPEGCAPPPARFSSAGPAAAEPATEHQSRPTRTHPGPPRRVTPNRGLLNPPGRPQLFRVF
jgi:hypothetical protein